MYSKRPQIVIGFHGCDKEVRDKVVLHQDILEDSHNAYDWLGHGIYFWEYSYERALEYANHIIKNRKTRGKNKIKNPAVLGAIIDLGYCLDLLDYEYLQLVKQAYETVLDSYTKFGIPMPENKKPIGEEKDLLIRNLDCLIIESLHLINLTENRDKFDSVRAVFIEGKELYENSGFHVKNHIQISVINPNCIKGFFIPRELNPAYSKP